jgi:hypothetical protein
MMGEKKYEKKFAPYIQIYIERVMHQRDGVRNRKVEKYKRTVWRIIHSAERGQHHNRSDFFLFFDSPAFHLHQYRVRKFILLFFFLWTYDAILMLYMLYTLE